MIEPLVSIIITAFNYGCFIGAALESACLQTYETLEILVLDDASEDDTAAVVEPYLSDSRVRYVRHLINLGTNANVNRGLSEARGDYLLFLAADDILETDFVTRVMSYRAAHPDVELVYTDIRHIDGSDAAPKARRPLIAAGYDANPNVFATLLSAGTYMCFATLIVPREFFARHGGFAPDIVASDYDLLLRWTAAGCRVAHLPEALVRVRLHERQISSAGGYTASGRDALEFLTLQLVHAQTADAALVRGYERRIERMVRWKARSAEGTAEQRAVSRTARAVLDQLERLVCDDRAFPTESTSIILAASTVATGDVTRLAEATLASAPRESELLVIAGSAEARSRIELLRSPRIRVMQRPTGSSEAEAVNDALAIAQGDRYHVRVARDEENMSDEFVFDRGELDAYGHFLPGDLAAAIAQKREVLGRDARVRVASGTLR